MVSGVRLCVRLLKNYSIKNASNQVIILGRLTFHFELNFECVRHEQLFDLKSPNGSLYDKVIKLGCECFIFFKRITNILTPSNIKMCVT